MIMLLRSAPIRTLSFEDSKSTISTNFWFRRAASSAASLTRLARSAPEKPGVARAARPHPHEHLHEVGAGDREEGDVGLAGDRAGEQRLARPRRPHEEHALRDPAPELLELLGLAQELDDLLQLLLGLVHAGDV